MRNFYSEGLLPTFRGRKHRFSFDLTANAYDGAPLSCNFHIFFTACTLQNSHVEALAHGKIKSGRKSLVKKKMKKKFGPKKKERKSTILPRKEKNFFVTATSTGRALCWRPGFQHRQTSPSNRNLPHIMLKRKSLFFILVPAFYTNIKSRLEL